MELISVCCIELNATVGETDGGGWDGGDGNRGAEEVGSRRVLAEGKNSSNKHASFPLFTDSASSGDQNRLDI